MASYIHIWMAAIITLGLVVVFAVMAVNNPPTVNNNVTVSQVLKNDLDPTPKQIVVDWFVPGGGAAGTTAGANYARSGKNTLICNSGYSVKDNILSRTPAFANSLTTSQNYDKFCGHTGVPNSNIFNNPFLARAMPACNADVGSGGPAINGGQCIRHTCEEWNAMALALNNTEWSCAAVYARYKRMEKFIEATWPLDASRGTNGDVYIRAAVSQLQVAQFYLNKTMPFFFNNPESHYINDYNDPATPIGGFERWQVTQRPTGNPFDPYWREMGERSFENDIQNNPNLKYIHNCTLIKLAYVRVGVNRKPRVYGGHVLINGEPVFIRALEGVHLAAGLMTSKILKYSGYGDTNELSELNVPVMLHNPNVGGHILTHPTNVFLGFPNPYVNCTPSNATFTSKKSSLDSRFAALPLDKLEEMKKNVLEYTSSKMNMCPVTTVASINSVTTKSIFEQTLNPELTNPFYQCTVPELTDRNALYAGGTMMGSPYNSNPNHRAFVNLAGYDTYPVTYFLFAGFYIDALSEGSVKLNSRNPFTHPRTEFGFFISPNATKEFADMTYLAKGMIKTLVNMSLIPVNYLTNMPIEIDPDDDYAVGNWVISNMIHSYHWSGGARMATSITDGVTDSHGRVFGVDGLYVGDTSSLPLNLAGQCSAMVVGLTVSDMAMADYSAWKLANPNADVTFTPSI